MSGKFNFNTVFERLIWSPIVDSVNHSQQRNWTDDATNPKLFGCVMELSAKEVTGLGRTLSEGAGKIVLNNLPTVTEKDRLRDTRTDIVYLIDGIIQDYLKDTTTIYVRRYEGGATR